MIDKLLVEYVKKSPIPVLHLSKENTQYRIQSENLRVWKLAAN